MSSMESYQWHKWWYFPHFLHRQSIQHILAFVKAQSFDEGPLQIRPHRTSSNQRWGWIKTRQHPVHLDLLPISSSGSLTGSGILGTVALDGLIEAMIGTVTATQLLSRYQYFPTQMTITISQSIDETKTRARHHIHTLRPDRDYIHVTVHLYEGACRFSTLYYPQIIGLWLFA